ncbi:MAG: hypothetical protein WA060_03595 [Minisyncoccia bacterium]
MSKKLIGLIVVVLVLIGGYFIFGGNKDAENEEPGNTNAEQQQTGKKMAFSEFLKQGGAYKCEVKQFLSDFENSGTMYVSGKNLRGEFSTVAEGKTMLSSFISRDGYSYTWSSLAPGMGFKIKVAENTKTTDTTTDTSGAYAWDADQIGDYNCENWVVDTAKFELPKDITFQEIKTNY